MAFRQLAPDYRTPFMIMGATILGSSVLTAFVHIKGYAMLTCGKDAIVDKETGEVSTGGTIAIPIKSEDVAQ
jgi:hypothetical protein